jgi:zinc/manganese transport system substrate-binding protein
VPATPAATAAPAATPVTAVNSGPRLTVIGTENFYSDLLTQIGGPRVNAFSFIKDPNADPHQFEANPPSAALVADANLIIVNGLGYDDWINKLIASSNRPSRIVIRVDKLLGAGDETNVHVWYDPATMPKVAAAAADALGRLDPQNAAYFNAQSAKYVAAFGPVNDKIASLRARYSGTPIAFTENVAGFMTDAIGLKVLTPLGFMKAIEQGIDPAPSDVAAERDLITGRKVKVLVYNGQVTSPVTKDIYDLAVKNNLPIVGVGETIPPGFATFQEWMLSQLNDLERALARG